MFVKRFVNNPVPSNCYVVSSRESDGDCAIIDPGSIDNNELLSFLTSKRLTPKYIVLTHEHFDHAWGVNGLVEKYSIPIVCSELCSKNIKDEWLNCSAQYDDNTQFVIKSKTISIESLHYTLNSLGGEFSFVKTPGHTDASLCVIVENYLFTGDTLIHNLKTVTKLPTGDLDKLKDSIMMLREMKGIGYTVCPGHGEMFELDKYDLNKALL